MHQSLVPASLVLTLVLSAGCEIAERPEPPTILRDTSMVDDTPRYIHPQVPGHRTTMDGRVALRTQGGPHDLHFYLFVPEKLDEPILTGPPGTEILASTSPVRIHFPPAADPSGPKIGHHAICDPTYEHAGPGDLRNPQPCGPDGANDCYELTIVSSTSVGLLTQMWGTEATVEVEHPKTADARIVRVELGTPVPGGTIPLSTEWTEPAVTIDGRLLTGRLGGAPRAWTNPETGEKLVRFYDLAYSVLPEDAEPCDVTGWTDFHPMSHAPYDPQMVGRYGLAAYPFRDSEGELIPDGEEMGGSYPWVDREGANVFMTGIPGRVSEQSEQVFPRRCVMEGCERYPEAVDWDRGFLVAGLWTHGKLVLLDALINNVDWAVGTAPQTHYLVDLYRDAAGQDVSVRVGAGRTTGGPRSGPDERRFPPGYSGNANILDSLQNLATHQQPGLPITPRDVVWVMGTGVATDEVVFDDYLDPNALIVSNMQASVTQVRTRSGATTGVPIYWNGQHRELLLPIRVPNLNTLFPERPAEVHIQNAATSLDWRVPAYGLMEAGTARVEPVALGGIKGKGLWLSGDDAVRYAIPAQDRSVRDHDWYVGIFVDPRTSGGDWRELLTFPDGSAIRLSGSEALRYVSGGEVIREIPLPGGEGWLHLGLRVREGLREVTLLVNGFPSDRFESSFPLFEMSEGEFVVGSAELEGPGFRGWIDELKVLAHDVNAEVACNHAHGTLIEVGESAAWRTVADAMPGWAQAEIGAAAGASGSARFACFHDYSEDYAANLGNLPPGSTSVRHLLNFPEGPLVAGAPRPDSSTNPFCLSCHHPEGKGGLSVDALTYRPGVVAENDPRRQPLQPPRRVFGNIPPGWIPPGPGPGSPAEATVAPPEGALIDRWVLPGVGDRAAVAGVPVHRH